MRKTTKTAPKAKTSKPAKAAPAPAPVDNATTAAVPASATSAPAKKIAAKTPARPAKASAARKARTAPKARVVSTTRVSRSSGGASRAVAKALAATIRKFESEVMMLLSELDKRTGEVVELQKKIGDMELRAKRSAIVVQREGRKAAAAGKRPTKAKAKPKAAPKTAAKSAKPVRKFKLTASAKPASKITEKRYRKVADVKARAKRIAEKGMEITAKAPVGKSNGKPAAKPAARAAVKPAARTAAKAPAKPAAKPAAKTTAISKPKAKPAVKAKKPSSSRK